VVAVGSFIAGCGLLMGLPDWISDKIILRSNAGYVLILAGIGVAFYYAIIPILPNVYKAGAEIVIGFEKGITILMSDGKASQIFALVGGFVMVTAGAVILYFRKRSK
jgi:LPXTG-motif cell wall-anchored protein